MLLQGEGISSRHGGRGGFEYLKSSNSRLIAAFSSCSLLLCLSASSSFARCWSSFCLLPRVTACPLLSRSGTWQLPRGSPSSSASRTTRSASRSGGWELTCQSWRGRHHLTTCKSRRKVVGELLEKNKAVGLENLVRTTTTQHNTQSVRQHNTDRNTSGLATSLFPFPQTPPRACRSRERCIHR